MQLPTSAWSTPSVGALLALLIPLRGQEPTISERLRSSDAEIRVAALAELAKGKATVPFVEVIAATLGDCSPAVRDAAVTALVTLRPDLEPAKDILRGIVAESGDVFWETAVGLGGAGAGRKPDLSAEDLDHADVARRVQAIRRICLGGRDAMPHQERLLAMAADDHKEVRLALVTFIHRLDWNDAIRATLVQALKDQEPGIRAQAALSLGFGQDEPTVVTALRSVIVDPEPTVRANALRALGRCPKSAEPAAGDVIALFRDRSPLVRIAALDAAASLGLVQERAVAGIRRCLEDTDEGVLAAALRAVAAARSAVASAWPRVMDLTRHTAASVRAEALPAVLRAAPPEKVGAAVLRLVEALLDPAEPMRASAVQALSEFVTP